MSALLSASEIGFQILKWAGCTCLAWLACNLFRAKATIEQLGEQKQVGLARVWAEGVLVNLLNPKVAIFILAFIPQFTDPARGAVWAQTIVLGTLFNIGGTLVNATIAGTFSRRLRRPRIQV